MVIRLTEVHAHYAVAPAHYYAAVEASADFVVLVAVEALIAVGAVEALADSAALTAAEVPAAC
jgi:hypothetical protein